MDERSWWMPEADDPSLALPDDLRARDPIGARDCGWVSQMRPFIRHFAAPGARVLDPFCGFGTTLLAAALENRIGVGVDTDARRIALARERLARHAVTAELIEGSLVHCRPTEHVTLCLTNVPYFGCRWPAAGASPDQLYRARDYEQHLHGLRDVFHAAREVLPEGGHCIAMAENIVIDGRMVPLAWDVGRMLAALFEPCEERVLVYTRPAGDLRPGETRSNRSHEYALIFRKQRARIDLAQTAQELDALCDAGIVFALHGSFARWRDGHVPETACAPADADIHLPADVDAFNRALVHLRDRGFALQCWGEPLIAPVTLPMLRERHYVRAERLDRDGKLVRIDLSLRPDDALPQEHGTR